ncbi:MAG: terminase family protein [Azospirillaceae bacterium]|nr:terminase family protein [Azospirillaceae bacterium]
MTGILLPYQTRWLQDEARFKLGMFSRQTGKTFTTTLNIVDHCMEAEARKRRERWVILSRGERQALEAMNEGVKLHLKGYGTAYDALEYDFPGNDATYRATEVALPNGSRITALPANPDTARGYSANVFLDEFAFHKDSRSIWKALFPVISRGGLKLLITSTPNGRNNKFYELWTGQDTAWSRHRVDIHQAVAEGLDRNIPELRAALNDEDAWRQEFELEFLEESTAWLSYDVIVGCEDPAAGKPDLYQGGPCLIGNDIARRKDLWVAWVWERVGDVLWTREIVELKGASFAAQDAEIARLMARYNVERLVMDQTGMGEKPVEDAQRAYGHKVEGVILQASTRLNVAIAAKQKFEDRKVRLPTGNATLRADLHKLKRIAGDTGAPRLVADRDGDGHADRTWAAFLGIAGGNDTPSIIDYYARLAAIQKAAEEAKLKEEAAHG